MNDKDFKNLVKSIKQAEQIRNKQIEPKLKIKTTPLEINKCKDQL